MEDATCSSVNFDMFSKHGCEIAPKHAVSFSLTPVALIWAISSAASASPAQTPVPTSEPTMNAKLAPTGNSRWRPRVHLLSSAATLLAQRSAVMTEV